MGLVLVIALPFVILGALILAQALGLGQFVGRALVPNFVLGIVGALFLGAGLTLLWKAYGGEGRKQHRSARILRSAEDQGGIFKMWVWMAFYLAFIGVLDYVFLVRGGRETPLMGWGVMGLFTLFAVYGAYTASRKTLEWFKYGSILLYLDAPAQTGATLGARIKVPDKLRPAVSVTATLSCIEKIRRRVANGKSPVETDNTVWSQKKALPIQWTGATGQVQLQFDIPFNRPATDLPDSGLLLEDRAYHRWELAITADVPGIDLDRTFALHVAPGKAPLTTGPVEMAPRSGMAEAAGIARTPGAPAAAPTVAGPAAGAMARSAPSAMPRTDSITTAPRRPSLMIESADIPKSWERPARIVAGIVGTLVIGWFMGVHQFFMGMTQTHKNAWPDAVAGPFEMKPDEYQQALRLFASGVKLERHGDDVRVRVEKLRMVKVKSSETVQYAELGAYLSHMPKGGHYRELAKWRDIDYRGTLAAGKSEDAIGPIEFSFKGNASYCSGGDCWLKLYAHVPSAHRYENTGATRFLFSQTSQIAAAIGGARTWEGWLERAQQAGWAGRADEARRNFDEGIAFVRSQHGETSAMHALMLMRYSEFLRRQSQREEEEKRLSQAVEIFSALDDTTIAAQIGTDWGQGSAMQEFAPRRLAEMVAAQGRNEEALTLYRSALAVIRRLGTKVSPYVLHLRSAENQIGIGASLCSLGRAGEAARELPAARGSAAQAEKLMEERWAKLFGSMPASQSNVHRPNYEREKAEHAARARRLGAVEERIKSGACGR